MTKGPPARYEPIAISSECTVVAEFVPDPGSEAGYQSEAELERVKSPMGLPIRALTPAEIAVSIVGELISVRRAGRG